MIRIVLQYALYLCRYFKVRVTTASLVSASTITKSLLCTEALVLTITLSITSYSLAPSRTKALKSHVYQMSTTTVVIPNVGINVVSSLHGVSVLSQFAVWLLKVDWTGHTDRYSLALQF